ncbi:aromatic ring-hydroxylating dioxygenase subunit alpha [Alteraurantiacibacter buctensis]|uniref:Rieske 2Fe-2S domain-containing protein n=1 Tax=Alteraurantiacibacter buctensis TaxID=1503981 RepID=A0A844YZA1_9SPHN|nr:aromatic ring-hydroxylating dioxygenase subunit alpha [Alteraurantiacibacter buctensis]MXO71794.1 Rieske 2Fe-2S domain-containing protein [Alteraurantiacibacter buctensis]
MDDPAQTKPDPVRAGTSTTGPDRNWPLNSWWVAAHASEVTEKPILRWIAEMPIAFYRTAEGTLAALHNRCPHRFAPLHKGDVEGDNLVCPYHGFQFAPSGQCVNVPTQEKTPAAIRVRSYPVVERYGFVWVWTGEVERADPDLIPADLAYLSDPAWHVVWGYLPVSGNFMQMKENVLDLTHFAFLHKNSAQITGWDRPPAVEVANGRVTFRQLFDMQPLPAIYAVPAGKAPGKLVNRDNWGTQLSPGAHHGAVDMHDPDPGPDGLERFALRIIHLTTPVSIGKTHYYWAMARDHGQPFDFAAMRAQASVIFGEDIEIVEASQEMARCTADHDKAVEFSVAADRAAIEGRRLVQAMVRNEAAE